MIASCKPLSNIPAAFLKVSDRQVDQLHCSVFDWERSPRSDQFADYTFQAFNCVGGVDDLPDGGTRGKEWYYLLPSSAPGGGD